MWIRSSEKGIIFNGKEYEVDCIIFATGFEVGTEYTRRCGYEIYGKNGLRLPKNGKMVYLHSTECTQMVFLIVFLGPQQGAFTANYTHSLDEQSIHLAYILKKMKGDKLTLVEASKEAEADWVDTIIAKSVTCEILEKVALLVITTTKVNPIWSHKIILTAVDHWSSFL